MNINTHLELRISFYCCWKSPEKNYDNFPLNVLQGHLKVKPWQIPPCKDKLQPPSHEKMVIKQRQIMTSNKNLTHILLWKKFSILLKQAIYLDCGKRYMPKLIYLIYFCFMITEIDWLLTNVSDPWNLQKSIS